MRCNQNRLRVLLIQKDIKPFCCEIQGILSLRVLLIQKYTLIVIAKDFGESGIIRYDVRNKNS